MTSLINLTLPRLLPHKMTDVFLENMNAVNNSFTWQIGGQLHFTSRKLWWALLTSGHRVGRRPIFQIICGDSGRPIKNILMPDLMAEIVVTMNMISAGNPAMPAKNMDSPDTLPSLDSPEKTKNFILA